jgi:hypothetical protein
MTTDLRHDDVECRSLAESALEDFVDQMKIVAVGVHSLWYRTERGAAIDRRRTDVQNGEPPAALIAVAAFEALRDSTVDLYLVVVMAPAWVLCRGWLSWKREPAPAGSAAQRAAVAN